MPRVGEELGRPPGIDRVVEDAWSHAIENRGIIRAEDTDGRTHGARLLWIGKIVVTV